MLRILLPLVSLLLVVTSSAQAQSFLDRLGNALNRDEAEPPAEVTRAQPRTAAPGYLGLTGDEIEGESGVFVAEVEEGTPADRAGFQPGDRITKIGDAEITTMDDMARVLQRRRAGERLVFVILRDGLEQQITATLSARRPAETDAVEEEVIPATEGEAGEAGPVLGAIVAPITEELRDRFGIEMDEGVVITGIEPGSPAHRQRLPIGGVIVDVNGSKIKTPEDLHEIVGASRAGNELELIYYSGARRYRTKLKLAPAAPVPPVAAARRPVTPPGDSDVGIDLEERLGEGGRRPVLGRVGRVLDDLIDEEPPPVPEGEDVAGEPAVDDDERPSNEVDLLREEIELLRREVDLLRRKVDELERRARR